MVNKCMGLDLACLAEFPGGCVGASMDHDASLSPSTVVTACVPITIACVPALLPLTALPSHCRTPPLPPLPSGWPPGSVQQLALPRFAEPPRTFEAAAISASRTGAAWLEHPSSPEAQSVWRPKCLIWRPLSQPQRVSLGVV